MSYLLLLWFPLAVLVALLICKGIRLADGESEQERPAWLD